jgi:hypothetical protein
MKTKEFWEQYMNKDILQIFDITCDFFSEELPDDFVQDYDAGEVILETKGHQEDAKNFENVLKFTTILQKHQPALYKEYFQFFDKFLVDYYCFHLDNLKIHEAFSNFLENPLQDYDIFLLPFKKLLFYQHSELLDQAITENFTAVSEAENLIGEPEFNLAICKFYMLLQERFVEDNESLNRTILSKKLAEYNFDFSDDIYSSIETGMFRQQMDADELKTLFKKNKINLLFILLVYFLRYMYEKGFAFYLGGKIWDGMIVYWKEINKKSKNTSAFFNVEASSFEKYMAELSGCFLLDNKSEMIAILWGSVYLYEFLNKHKLITEQQFDDFIEMSRELKGKIIGQHTSDLWNSNFVHHWEKPECISEAEFVEESKIFAKSISFKHLKFSRLRSEIKEELAGIGKLSDYIIEGEKEKEEDYDTSLLDKFFNSYDEDGLLDTHDEDVLFDSHDEDELIDSYDEDEFFDSHDEEGFDEDCNRPEPIKYTGTEPIKKEKKPGRNDPCPCGSGKKYKKCCGKI